MSKANEFLKAALHKIESFFIKAGDRGIALLWCGVFSLILFLVFVLSSGVRTRLMETQVNNVLAQNGYSRSLGAPVTPWLKDGAAMQFGSWWTMRDSESLAVVFPVIRDGIYSPFLGIIAANGTVEFVPLSRNAEVLYERLMPGTMDVYTRRLHLAAEKVVQGRIRAEGRENEQ
ncbi:MAG: hypothetical protein LBL31_02055 [Spirochaetaceae bacterium]|nr:hypothetical protein [Spirochaetaceae bacterium]